MLTQFKKKILHQNCIFALSDSSSVAPIVGGVVGVVILASLVIGAIIIYRKVCARACT